MKRPAIILFITLLSFFGPTLALAQGQGVIEGVVTNGTSGEPVAGQGITLRLFKGMEEEEALTSSTDEGGRFRFQNLATGGEYAYLVQLVYQEVGYTSDVLTFTEGESRLDVPITVYETTESDAALRIERAHFFIDFDPQARAISVGEMYIFTNEGDKVYIGEDGATLRFSLPPGARDLRFERGALGERFLEIEGGFVDTKPVPPGVGARQFLFSYALSYDANDYILSKEIFYPIATLNVLVPDIGVQVSSDQVAFQGVQQTEGQAYLNFVGQNLARGERLILNLSNLPQSGGVEAVLRGGYRLGLRWVVVGLVVLAVVFALSYPLLKR
jgi:hypothetical protein